MRTHTQPPTDHTTGAELQTLREAAGLTREALAELVGVQARTVKHWEGGRAGVPADVAHLMRGLAQWVRTAAIRMHHHHQDLALSRHLMPPLFALDYNDLGIPLHTHTRPGRQHPQPATLWRYKDTAHMHPAERAAGLRHEVHGAAVALAVQLLALDRLTSRVVWFEPEHYAAWRDATKNADTPASRAEWAASQGLPSQAIPPRGDQPPADFGPGYTPANNPTTQGRSRP